MDDFEQELKADFLEESADLLADAEAAFLKLESDRENLDLINQIFRLAHNLKGTSKAVGFDQLSELTHTAENLILKLKEGELKANDRIISVLLSFKDKVNEMVEGLKQDMDQTFDTSEIRSELVSMTENSAVEEPEPPSVPTADDISPVPSPPRDICEDSPLTIEAISPNEEQGAPENFVIDDPKESEVSIVEAKESNFLAASKKPVNNSPKADGSIRVKLSRIGKINDILGELVILQTVISQRRFEFCQDEIMNKSIGSMNKLFKEVQEIAMSLRMLPLKPNFQKMSRIVRDVSMALGKDVDLQIIGEDTEVDKTILEKIQDPLVHIVRNAVDHGLETPENRVQSGKDPKGSIKLKAYHEGSSLVVEVEDDGKGIDPEKLRQKAIAKGILAEDQVLSKQELIHLIFHPGFSTKELVTDVSGRGVGMDVVKTNIEGLGGEVRIDSHLGKGSSFKIILPLTLAIIEGLVISSRKEKYVIPLSQISEIVQLREDRIQKFSGVASLYEIRGEVMPVFSIDQKLGIRDQASFSRTAIIIRGLGHSFAVSVEDIVNQQQIVIKKMGKDLQGKKGVMGSAIMSDGRPSLILDLFELFCDDVKNNPAYRNFRQKRQLSV